MKTLIALIVVAVLALPTSAHAAKPLLPKCHYQKIPADAVIIFEDGSGFLSTGQVFKLTPESVASLFGYTPDYCR